MGERPMNVSATHLTEENLRIHNAACPKRDGFFQINLIREERAMAVELATYRQIFGDMNEMEDADFDVQDTDMSMRRKASVEALKLYTGALASLEAPMSRFMAMSPAHDTHPWLAKNTMKEAGIVCGDLETLDVRHLASELIDFDGPSGDTDDASAGSPRPSSDTLSVSRLLEMRPKRKEGARTRKRIGMRRHKTASRSKKSNSNSLTFGKS